MYFYLKRFAFARKNKEKLLNNKHDINIQKIGRHKIIERQQFEPSKELFNRLNIAFSKILLTVRNIEMGIFTIFARFNVLFKERDYSTGSEMTCKVARFKLLQNFRIWKLLKCSNKDMFKVIIANWLLK